MLLTHSDFHCHWQTKREIADGWLGLFEVNTSGSNNRANEKKARVFAAACNARIRSANPAGIAKAEASSSTNYGEIEKLGELLNKGLLTQKEFDAKKKQILGL